MTKEEIYAIWAPSDSIWSRWAKPVLFAHVDSPLSFASVVESELDMTWAPPVGEQAALVIDLPGAEGVFAGLTLAKAGYRPVPLYNALPLPFGHSSTSQSAEAVDVWPIVAALRTGAEQLASRSLSTNAPPAFLLDSCRRAGYIGPSDFDNRSVSFTTDFPSANFLAAQGIRRIVLIQNDLNLPQEDLAHTLLRWQDGGFQIEVFRIGISEKPQLIKVPRPSWYGVMFQKALISLGLRRSVFGGFGQSAGG